MIPKKIKNKVKMFASMLKSGKLKDVFAIIKKRTYSNIYFFMVKQDIHLIDFDNIPKARIDVTIRPYEDSDHKHFQNLDLADKLLEAKIPTCYVAVTNEGIPCYRVWLFEPSQNNKTKAFFGYNYPKLKKDEFILEMVYTVKEFRKSYLMVTVNYMLFKKAKELGYKWAVGCISINNKPSLKGANRLGAHPYKLQITKWRFFTRKTIYVDIPEKLKAKYPQLIFPY